MLDEPIAKDVRQHWNEVVEAYSAIRLRQMAGVTGSMMFGFPHAVQKLADVAYCMLVFMAFSTLELFLEERESAIGLAGNAKSRGLKALITKSQKPKNGVEALQWSNRVLADEGRELRDDLAHHHLTEERAITLRYVKAVQDELAVWLGGLEMIDFDVLGPLKRRKK